MSETVTASATRVVNASSDKVWLALTEPQHVERWFDAKPGSAHVDLRTNGTWSAIVTPDGHEIHTGGRYVEVADHRRLVMTIPNGPEHVAVTIDLVDLGDRTRLTSSTPAPPEVKQIVEDTAGSILDAVAAIAESI